MDWIEIKNEKPFDHGMVLVRSDKHGDGAFDYFVAQYWKLEKEWILHLNFKSGDPYIKIYRKVLKNDEWTHID